MEDAKENMEFEHMGEADELADLGVVKRPRETPRTSMSTQEQKPTPYADLRALAGLIRKTSTPSQRRPLSIGSACSAANDPSQTPLHHPSVTPRIRRPLQQILPAGSKPTTPHTIRALQQRRATPGQDRRKSGRAQRETPRDALRNLSKILAASSQPLTRSSQSAAAPLGALRRQREDDFEDELSPEQPHLTIAVEKEEDGDDESSLLDRPRLSIPVEDEELTVASVENARRGSLQDEQQRPWRRQSGSLTAGEHLMERSMDLGMDHLNADLDDEKWQDINDDTSFPPDYANSRENLQRIARENSRQRDRLSSNSQEQIPQSPVFSPFVLDIPKMVPQDVSKQIQTYEDLLSEDIEQFGSPLLNADVSQPHLYMTSLQRVVPKTAFKARARRRAPQALKVSRHGISYSSLPVGIVKSISTAFARSEGKRAARLSKDSINAVLNASDKFFEQLSGDLAAASNHAGRKTIDESDVLAVMRRQRQISARASAFSIGAKYLPSETLAEMRMPFPRPDQVRKTKHRLDTISEDLE